MRSLRLFPAALAAMLSLALLCACGQKGPLYLGENPPAGTKIPKPAAPKPVPYPADAAGPDKRD